MVYTERELALIELDNITSSRQPEGVFFSKPVISGAALEDEVQKAAVRCPLPFIIPDISKMPPGDLRAREFTRAMLWLGLLSVFVEED